MDGLDANYETENNVTYVIKLFKIDLFIQNCLCALIWQHPSPLHSGYADYYAVEPWSGMYTGNSITITNTSTPWHYRWPIAYWQFPL
jgi:hypothetical protein